MSRWDSDDTEELLVALVVGVVVAVAVRVAEALTDHALRKAREAHTVPVTETSTPSTREGAT